MNKNKLLLLFLLHCMIGFSQTESFDPLDELGSGYGTRDIPAIKNHEINFPSPSEEQQPINNATKVNKKNFDFDAYVNAYKTNIRAKLQTHQDKNVYAKVQSYDAGATNFKRFQNSPCFDEIGFNPTWDLTSLEKRYSDCESQKNIKIVMNALYILAFAVIIGIVLYFSRKKPI